jgi:hypothetical protein
LTKKADKEEHKNDTLEADEYVREDCSACEAQRRREVALINAELIIQEAENRSKC